MDSQEDATRKPFPHALRVGIARRAAVGTFAL